MAKKTIKTFFFKYLEDFWLAIKRLHIYIWCVTGLVLFFAAPSDSLSERLMTFTKQESHTIGEIGAFRALIIGIDDYSDPNIKDLESAVLDARAMADILQKKYNFSVQTLYNRQATKDAIYNALRDLAKSSKPDESILIYYAGHGDIDELYSDGWWIPYDAKKGQYVTYFDNVQVQKAIRRMEARHVLLISDSCYSGTLLGETRALPSKIDDEYYINLYSEKSRWGMTSGNKTPVLDSTCDTEGHSAFAFQLLKELRTNKMPYISDEEIYTRIAPTVAKIAYHQPMYRPIINTGDEGGRFIFVSGSAVTANKSSSKGNASTNEHQRKIEVDQLKQEVLSQSKLALASKLAAQSSRILSTPSLKPKDLEKGALLAIESLKCAQTVEGYQAWEQAVLIFPAWQQKYKLEKDLGPLVLSPDGKRLLTVVKEGAPRAFGKACILDVKSGSTFLNVDHNGGVTDLAFSPDNLCFATASWDRTITLSSMKTGQILATFSHDEPVKRVIFSSNSKYLSAICRDGTVTIYDPKKLKKRLAFLHKGGIIDALITPDSRFMVTAGKDKSVVFWNFRTGKRIKEFNLEKELVHFLISPDGKKLICRYENDKAVGIWDIKSQNVLFQLEHDSPVLDIAVSNNGHEIVTTIKGFITVWDAESGSKKEAQSFKPCDIEKINLSQNADKISILAGNWYTENFPASDPDQIMIWHQSLQGPVRTFDLPLFECIAFSLDGRRIALTGTDYTIRLLDAENGKELNQIQHESKVIDIKFSPDGSHLAYAIDMDPLDSFYRYSWSEAVVLDLEKRQELIRFGGNPARISDISFSPDGKQVATSSWNGTVTIWDGCQGKVKKVLTETGPVMTSVFSQDGKNIITKVLITNDKYNRHLYGCHIRDLKSSNLTAAFPSPGGILSWKLLKDEYKLWTAGADATIRLWNLKDGHELNRATLPPSEKVYAFHPHGESVATFDPAMKNRVIIRDLPSGEKKSVFLHETDVGRVDFSPDGKIIAAENINRLVLTIWDLKTGTILSRITNPENVSKAKIPTFQYWKFNFDGSLLAITDLYGTVRIWNPRNGEMVSEFQHPWDKNIRGFFMIATSFSGDGKYIITQSGDSIVVWDPVSGLKRNQITYSDVDVLNIAASPNGKMFRTLDKGGDIIWDINSLEKLFYFKNKGNSYLSVHHPYFNVDGRYYSFIQNGKLHLWDIPTKKHTIIPNIGDPSWLYILPDMEILLSINRNRNACVRDLKTGGEKYCFGHIGTTSEVFFQPSGNIAVSANRGMIETYDLNRGSKVAGFLTEAAFTVETKVSPDGSKLLTANGSRKDKEKYLHIWDTRSGERLNNIPENTELSDEFAFNSNATQLAVKADNKIVHIWNLENNEINVQLPIESSVDELRFSPDDAMLAIATDDDQLQIWDIENKTKIIKIPHVESFNNYIFHHDCEKIITSNNEGVIRVWGIEKPGIQKAALKHEKNISKMVITLDGQFLVTMMGYKIIDDYVAVWGLNPVKEHYRIHHFENSKNTIQTNTSSSQKDGDVAAFDMYIYDIALSPDGKNIVTAGSDSTIKVWRLRDGQKIAQWNCQYGDPKVTYSGDGKHIMIHTETQEKENGYSRVRDYIEVRSVIDKFKTISQIDGYFSKAIIASNGKKIFTAEGEQEHNMHNEYTRNGSNRPSRRPINNPSAFWGIRVWETSTGKELLRISQKRPVYDLSLNPKKNIVGIHDSAEDVMRFFDITTGEEIQNFPELKTNSKAGIVFCAENGVVAVYSYDKIAIWETDTWKQVAKISCADSIDDLKFSPKNHYLAWKNEGKIWIWDWENDRKLAIINAKNDYGRPFLFSPEEKHIIAADDQGNVNIFLWHREDLIADGCRRLEHNLSKDDWLTYIGNESYEETCPGLPEPGH